MRVEDGNPALVQAIKSHTWHDVPGLSARERALCTLAQKLSETPTKMTEDNWVPLRDLGFDDAACLEVAHIVGIFNHLTRLADGFGLQLDTKTEEASKSGKVLGTREQAAGDVT